ncbi:MAG: rRNA pseudouridine synthase [Puniceicoccales bacterium]|jgi:23S rRNA pseudouridine2605 synthase|nr:rRNA pseudouridine synthase [Puniceicoccales bacterium]
MSKPPPPATAPKTPPAADGTPLRLQKFLSQAGVCSRRAAETLIRDGAVTVNGHRAEIGQSVTAGDDVRVEGRRITAGDTDRVVLILNKPRGFLCTNDDPKGGRTVFEMVPPEFADRKLFCVGRLDKDSEGMLLITDDGDFANRVMHPSNGVEKRYRVTVNRPFDPVLIPRLLKGAKDGDDFLRFKRVLWNEREPERLEVRLAQGRKREIRRLLEIFGFFVKTLFRFQIGALELRRMPPGDCRKLSQKEIALVFATPKAATGGATGNARSARSARPRAARATPAPSNRRRRP